MKKHLTFLLIFTTSFLFAQSYLPGETYFGEKNYIEYLAGNLPIVLTAPHGGDLKPDEIADRDCDNCVYVKDSYTQELIRETVEAINEETGCFPHAVINLLHRTKLDANRAIGDAADGDLIAEQAWADFHHFTNAAKELIEIEMGPGLYFDLHGHGHDIQRIELGYLITGTELRKTDSELNSNEFYKNTSLAHAVEFFEGSIELSELIRGEISFGAELEAEGYPAVPSPNDLAPNVGESFFSGGYNTAIYGSLNGGMMDGIQIECNQDIRFVEAERKLFAKSLAKAILRFYDSFGYDYTFESCKNVSTQNTENQSISIFPNPASDYLTFKGIPLFSKIKIYDAVGRKVVETAISNEDKVALDLIQGFYFIEIFENGKRIGIRELVILK